MVQLQVRLLQPMEQAKYQELMERYHYLGALQSNLGKALQYVAEDSESGEWYALLDWGYGSLKNGARDRWLGWNKELLQKRLKYVVTNTRFLILPGMPKIKNLASQILSLTTKRLSDDWARYHGHHVLLAETFVDIRRFKGICYRAANWIEVGLTNGFGRKNSHYHEHGEPKLVFVFTLYRKSREMLNSTQFPHRLLMPEMPMVPAIDLNRLPLVDKGGLFDALRKVLDGRSPRGQRYPLISILGLTVCALLTGIDSFTGIAEYGKALPMEVRIKLGFRLGLMPSDETIRRTINVIDPLQFDAVVHAWLREHGPKLRGRAIAVDGKTMRGSRTTTGAAPHILNVLLHNDGITLASRVVTDKENEIPVAREILRNLPIEGATVTLDALHTQRETAKFIVAEKRADYIMTVKENQPALLEKLQRLPDEAFSPSADNDK